MNRQQLVEQIFLKRSYLCVGLDSDFEKIPTFLLENDDPVFEFNKQIIDSTRDLCVSYKINTAFYESLGLKGWQAMDKTVAYIGNEHLVIADAKRGDIGNTSSQYAKAFFETIPFDAITVAPYMGHDSVQPFLDYKNKWTILLGLTSNSGAEDFEMKKIVIERETLEEGVHLKNSSQKYLYEQVLQTAAGWANGENLMFVVGATQANEFINIRKIIPTHFLLVPGVGAQGGSLKEISAKAMIADCGLLVNASRSIIFASAGNDFADAGRLIAKQYQQEMNAYLPAR